MPNNNPIKYSDLVAPDNAITDLITQLQDLMKQYKETAGSIKAEAQQLVDSIKKVSGATEDGRGATKQAATDADRLAKAQRDLAFAQSETAREIAELKAAQSEANQINKLTVKLNNSAEGSYNRLSAQYSLNKIRINSMTDAERENAEQTEGLITKTRELYEEMKRLQEETGKHQLNVGNYPEVSGAIAGVSDKLTELIGLNGQFGQSILALGRGGTETKAIFTAMGDGVKALGTSLMGLLTNPVFIAIAGIAGAGVAFKWWYDYNAGLVEATRLTQQFTSKSGDDLKAYRNQVQAVADTFDKDFKEVLIASNAVSKQFGISADEALNLIQDGFVAGADANGEFLDTLKEYPAYFKEAGISADQFVAIVAQSNKAGIFSDKGVDAIKEANLRLREMTTATAEALDAIGISSVQVQEDLQSGAKTTFQVMQEVSQKLNELPESSAAVGTAIADIFGGAGEDAGLQYLQTLKDISLNLDDVKSKAGILGELQEKQLQSQLELQNALAGLFDMTGGNFETLQTRVKIFINGALTGLIKGVINLINYVVDFYNNSLLLRVAWQGIVLGFKNAFDTIGNIFQYFIDVVKAAGTTIKGIFTFDWDDFKKGISGFANAIPNLMKSTMKDVKENFDDGIDNINNRLNPITIPVTVDTSDVDKVVNQVVKSVEKTTKSGGGSKPIERMLGLTPVDSEKIKGKAVATTKSTIAAVGNVVEQTTEGQKQRGTDIYSIFGLNLDDDTKAGIDSSVQYAMDALNSFVDEYVAASERKVERADREVDAAQKALELEIEARNAGYAHNVATAQKELEMAKRNQAKALDEQRKAQKAQAAIQSIQQAGDLVTASAMIWSQLGFPWAIPALAIMWGSFAASKIKAAQMAKSETYGDGTVEMLVGGSHQSGNDIDLGTKPDGTRRRAEGGEFFAVINKRNSRKYRNIIPDVINSLNNGTFATKYMNAYASGDGVTLNVQNQSSDLRELSDDVREIREQNKRRIIVDKDGNVIEIYKNLTRKIKS